MDQDTGPRALRLQALEEKARKYAGDEAVDGLMNMETDELRDRLVSLAQHERDTEDSRDGDAKLADLKEQVKEAGAPYADTLKSVKVQRQLISMLLESQGKS